jgi:hypothetical protein
MVSQVKVRKPTTRQEKTTRGNMGEFDRGVWNYMRNQLKMEEADILKMKMAKCPAKINGTPTEMIRFFDSDIAQQKGVTINDYIDLNEHPDLILYEGYHTKGKSGEVLIKMRNGTGTSFIEEKIKNREISDIGIIVEKKGAQKFLAGFGKFLMMGGFMLVLIVVVAIVIAISVIFK